jgi:hypothetical protein
MRAGERRLLYDAPKFLAKDAGEDEDAIFIVVF